MTAPRRGLVLGSGGVLGLAWMIGALRTIEEELGFDPRDAEAIVGTSAGSLLTILLAAGASTEQLVAHQGGERIAAGPLAGIDVSPDGVVDMRLRPPRLGLGSRQLMANQLRRPGEVTPSTFLAGLVPAGRGSLDGLGQLVDAVAPTWPDGAGVEIVAMDYDTGQRVVFGSPAARAQPVPADVVRLEDEPTVAVRASCSIPGWFSPVESGGRRLVDGGSVSVSSADLLAGRDLDEVFVLAPMAAAPAGRSPATWLVRRWRQHQILRTRREVGLLRGRRLSVRLFAPTPEDLAAAGPNLMDPMNREAVLETALRTTRARLRRRRGNGHVASGAGGTVEENES